MSTGEVASPAEGEAAGLREEGEPRAATAHPPAEAPLLPLARFPRISESLGSQARSGRERKRLRGHEESRAGSRQQLTLLFVFSRDEAELGKAGMRGAPVGAAGAPVRSRGFHCVPEPGEHWSQPCAPCPGRRGSHLPGPGSGGPQPGAGSRRDSVSGWVLARPREPTQPSTQAVASAGAGPVGHGGGQEGALEGTEVRASEADLEPMEISPHPRSSPAAPRPQAL